MDNIKEQLEEVIKKNLPEKKEITYFSEENRYFNQALSKIDTSLIADEVLKVVVENVEKCILTPKDFPKDIVYKKPHNDGIRKVLQLLSNLSTKE